MQGTMGSLNGEVRDLRLKSWNLQGRAPERRKLYNEELQKAMWVSPASPWLRTGLHTHRVKLPKDSQRMAAKVLKEEREY